MASNRFELLYQCVSCGQQLSRLSKCLPCLHSVCQSCFVNTLDEAKTNCTCPECLAQFVDWEDFVVSPILAKELMHQELASSSQFQCDLCSEDGSSSVAKFLCRECRTLLCNHCIRSHKKFQKTHISKDLDAMPRSDAIALLIKMQSNCSLHEKELEMYCEGCGNCYCNKCYATHVNDTMTPCTYVTPLRIRDEVVKRKEQFLTLGLKMTSFKEDVKALTDNTLRFVSEFKSDCKIKRTQIWTEYESICEKAKHDALRLNNQIDDGMQEILAKCYQLTLQNDEILQEISTWWLNFDHLLSEDRQHAEVLCGMRMLEKRCPVLRHVLPPTEPKYDIFVKFPDYWREIIDSLQNEDVRFVMFEKVGIKIKNISRENRFDLPEASKTRWIRSIYVDKKDEHIFACDQDNKSLIEINKNGEIRTEFQFYSVTNDKYFEPYDICLIPTENIFVICGCHGNRNLLFLKERTNFPFFQLTNFVETKTDFISLCEKNETIFVFDKNLKINSFSKKGDKLEIFQPEGLNDRTQYYPSFSRIRVDPLSGKIWFSNLATYKLICFDSNFKQINSMEKEEQFVDFQFNKFGQLFFCDLADQICCFPNQKLFKFEEHQKYVVYYFFPIFAFEKKFFVCVEKNGKFGIEIFNIFFEK